MNKTTEKWDKTGLLDGLKNELDKTILSENLEDAAKLLIAESINNPNKDNEAKAGIFLPIVCRLFRENVRIVDMNELFKKFNDFFDKQYLYYRELEEIHNVDGEAEFCGMFVEGYCQGVL